MKTINYKLDKNSKTPLNIQLYEQIKNDIIKGNISEGERLPSRRNLTAALGISKSTAELAYRRLEEDGLAISKPSSGRFAKINKLVNTEISEPDFYFNPGIEITMSQNGTDLSLIPRNELIKLYRDFAYDMPELFDYGHKFGEKALRKAIARNLNNLHGFGCSADKIIVGAGTEYLIEQLAHIFPKGSVFGFENTNFARSYIPVVNSGADVRLINNTLDGFSASQLYEKNIDVLYLSPDSQFPTNHRMTLSQRKEVLAWAEEAENRYIIEADFDLDFSDKGSLEPLYCMDKAEKVIFMGSFSRSISPAVKTAYIVLPSALKEAFNKALPYYVNLSSRLEQQVLAKFLHSGRYLSLCEKLKKTYAQKRRNLLKELKSSPLGQYIKINNHMASTYFIITIENGMSQAELKASAAKWGVKLLPLSVNMRTQTNDIPENAFIMGYGGLSAPEIKAAVVKLNRAWVKN